MTSPLYLVAGLAGAFVVAILTAMAASRWWTIPLAAAAGWVAGAGCLFVTLRILVGDLLTRL
jgi:hypothetical protein